MIGRRDLLTAGSVAFAAEALSHRAIAQSDNAATADIPAVATLTAPA